MSQKDQLTPPEQRKSFALAFDTVQHYLAAGNFIGAYVVAFSILEDRITAMFLTCLDEDAGCARRSDKQRRQRLNDKIRLLVSHGVITDSDQAQWCAIADKRNRKLHDAMWNLHEFQVVDVEQVIAAARRAINLRKVQKRAVTRQS